MVSKLTNVTSLTGNGLRDWLIQRVTSVILGVYILFLIGFFIKHPHIDYFVWQNLFANTSMRIFTIFALLSLSLHAWVGMWTVVTDYLKWTWLRFIFQMAVILALIAYVVWGINILWSA
jgi:succinate dehydrogenase / fumarate reductase membrane anchor subunit